MPRLLLVSIAFAALVAGLLFAPGTPAAASEAPLTGGEPVRPAAAEDCEHDAPADPRTAVTASTPFGTTPCPGVRPGGYARITTASGGSNWCTLNFVFRGTDSLGRVTMYIGTAGHCVINSGERSWGTGPAVFNTAGTRIGNVAYAINSGNRDFALVRLASGVSFSARMCHFGGPRGINNERPETGFLQLPHYGQGLGAGDTVPARTAVARGMPHRDRIYAWGAVAPGDSGSPVLAPDGRAVGVVVTVGAHYNISNLTRPETGSIGMTRVGPQLARAGAVLNRTMRVVQAPLH